MKNTIVGILFSDVVGFSNLTEARLSGYSNTILDELAKQIIEPHREHLRELNTWGDAIMLTSNDPTQLARLALSLRDFYKHKAWRRLNIKLDLSVRIALHVATVTQVPNPILGKNDVFGTDLTVAARIEPVTPPNTIWTTEQFKTLVESNDSIMVFDDLGDVPLAKEAGERHLFHLRRSDEPEANLPIKREIQIVPDTPSRYEQIEKRLEQCKAGDIVRFIAMTGKSFMLPEVRIGESLISKTFPNALSRGVKFKGIVLAPESKEAEFRAQTESPTEPIPKNRLLQKDAVFVKNLSSVYEKHEILRDKIPNLELRYIDIGIAFSLWLFDDVAFIEPFHFGKIENNKHLCGFRQLKIPKPAPEFELLGKHFEVLWNNSRKVWSRQKPKFSKWAGVFKDDPLFEEVMKNIADERERQREEARREAETSTCKAE